MYCEETTKKAFLCNAVVDHQKDFKPVLSDPALSSTKKLSVLNGDVSAPEQYWKSSVIVT